MKLINRIPVVAWLLLVGAFVAMLLFYAGHQKASIVCFILIPLSYFPRVLGPSPDSKREEVGLALLMRPVGYTAIIIVGLIIQAIALCAFTYDWFKKLRSPKYSSR